MKIKESPQLVASIMCADQLALNEELDRLLEAGITHLHCDIMDGIFVNNLAMGPYLIEALQDRPEFTLDLHLATVDPEKYIRLFGPLKPDYITFHVETTTEVKRLIELIRSYGVKPGLAYSPMTSNEAVLPYLDLIDLLLVMTVEPGFAGQTFQRSVLSKVRELIQQTDDSRPLLQVDGNIHAETMQWMQDDPIDWFVLGTSALFDGQTDNYQEKAQALHPLIN